jgi:hypothetical protein
MLKISFILILLTDRLAIFAFAQNISDKASSFSFQNLPTIASSCLLVTISLTAHSI